MKHNFSQWVTKSKNQIFTICIGFNNSWPQLFWNYEKSTKNGWINHNMQWNWFGNSRLNGQRATGCIWRPVHNGSWCNFGILAIILDYPHYAKFSCLRIINYKLTIAKLLIFCSNIDVTTQVVCVLWSIFGTIPAPVNVDSLHKHCYISQYSCQTHTRTISPYLTMSKCLIPVTMLEHFTQSFGLLK